MTHKLHVYTGLGKGKTTAAMGLALRCLGHGNRVLVTSFMKNGDSGEILALRALPGAILRFPPPMEKFTFLMTPEELSQTKEQQTAFARSLLPAIEELSPSMVLLDELCPALALGLIDPSTARALVGAALQSGETVVTGRDAPDWLLSRADYISRIQNEKHPFDTEGLPGREGVEW